MSICEYIQPSQRRELIPRHCPQETNLSFVPAQRPTFVVNDLVYSRPRAVVRRASRDYKRETRSPFFLRAPDPDARQHGRSRSRDIHKASLHLPPSRMLRTPKAEQARQTRNKLLEVLTGSQSPR